MVGKKQTIQTGFTIVELLIVIVVIAILAAISIVAYTGIQDRANDAAVRSDLATIAKQQELFKVDSSSGKYAYGNTGTLSYEALDVKVTKGAYQQSDAAGQYNLVNCTIDTGARYALLAVSRSGKRLYVSSDSPSVQEYTGASDWLTTASCASILPGSIANGAGYGYGAWRAWAE